MGGERVEIWFAPSFSIKTNDKRLDLMFRHQTVEAYDPIQKRVRPMRASKSILEAYYIVEEYKARVPELNIEIEEAPALEDSTVYETNKNEPVTD
jgi:hypothetical protein